MNVAEIERMACLETDHWWYQGLRQMIARTLSLRKFSLPPTPRILDAGCGTGGTLRLLERMYRPTYLGGFDISPWAVHLAKSNVGRADIYQSDIRRPQLHTEQFDLIVSCDVISIAGVPECREGLQRLAGALSSGGLFILNLPAFEWMRSRHDQAIGTRDRLCAPRAHELLAGLGLNVEMLTYRLFSLFPVIAAMRLPCMFKPPSYEPVESDLRPTCPWVNSALAKLLDMENAVVSHGIRLPWGSSVYAVGRKP